MANSGLTMLTNLMAFSGWPAYPRLRSPRQSPQQPTSEWLEETRTLQWNGGVAVRRRRSLDVRAQRARRDPERPYWASPGQRTPAWSWLPI